jgi:hypothetical protein
VRAVLAGKSNSEEAATPQAKRVYGLSGASAVVALLAVVVPRWVPNQEGGLAASATAVLVMFAFLFVAALLALVALTMTARSYSLLPRFARVVGIAPSVVIVGVLLFLFGFLRYG